MAVLTGGTAIAQLITFGGSPILSRIFTEEEYGSYGIYTSVISYFLVIGALRLEQAIILPKSDDEAKSIAKWAIRLNTYTSSGASVLSVFAVFIFDLSYYLLLLGPTVFFMGLINIYYNYSVRIKSFSYNSKAKIWISLMVVFVSIVLGYFNFGDYGLILGMLSGQLIGGAYLYTVLNKKLYIEKAILSWKELKKKYGQFIFINTPNALFDLTESAGIVLLLGVFFDKSNVGAYFFAFRILKLPLGLIGTSIFQVFYKEASELYGKRESIFPLFKKLTFKLGLYSFPIFLGLFYFSEDLFAIVFGKEWTEAGRFAGYFAPWFWLNFIASTISCIPIIVNKQNLAFMVSIFNTVIRLLIILITGFYYSFEVLIITLAIVQPIIMTMNNFWYYYLAKNFGQPKEESTYLT